MREAYKAALAAAAVVALLAFGAWFVATQVPWTQQATNGAGCLVLRGLQPPNSVAPGAYRVTVFDNGTSVWCPAGRP